MFGRGRQGREEAPLGDLDAAFQEVIMENTGGGERLTASGKFPAGLPFPGLLSPRAFHLSSQALSLQPVNQLLPPRMGLPYPSNKPRRVAYGKWQLEWRRFAHFQISKQRAS